MDERVSFSNNDRLSLQEIVNILKPFHEISIECQSDSIVMLPAVSHLIDHLCDVKSKFRLCRKLVAQLQLSFDKRFSSIIIRLYIYFMVTVLDRDLKLYPISENRLNQQMIQLILNEISKDFKTSSKKFPEQNSSFQLGSRVMLYYRYTR